MSGLVGLREPVAVPRTLETLRQVVRLANTGRISTSRALGLMRETLASMDPDYLHEHFAEIAEVCDSVGREETVEMP